MILKRAAISNFPNMFAVAAQRNPRKCRTSKRCFYAPSETDA